MLILSRKVGESILIDDYGISITVLELDGRTVRLGIEAPKHVRIYREEVVQKILEENRSAANSGQDLGSIADLFKQKEPGDG